MAANGQGGVVENVTDTVQQFCLITGCTEERAKSILEACNFDLQVAINLQMESVEQEHNTSFRPDSQDNGFVRAPILPREDILVNSFETHNVNRSNGIKRNGGPVFDSFRDFQVEADHQESALQFGALRGMPHKMRRLEDLYRPPIDMMFHGTFQMARDAGIVANKWLMVNPQNMQEFQCQILNRDIWSDSAIKSIVDVNFIFWQIYDDSAEGQQYNQYYNVERFPYVSVIDPRTGELLKKWHVIEKPFFAEQLLHFLTEHPLPTNQSPESSRSESRVGQEPPRVDSVPSLATRHTGNVYSETAKVPFDRSSRYGSSEAYQPKPKVKHNVESTVTSNSFVDDAIMVDDSDSGDESDDAPTPKKRKLNSYADNAAEASSSMLGSNVGPLTALSLRFPDSTREIVKFPSNSKVQILAELLTSRGFPRTKYQYVTYFPKRVLSSPIVAESTFLRMGIIHNDTVYIHSKDNAEEAD